MKDYTEEFIKTVETSENLISSAADFLSDWEETEAEANSLSETCAWLRGVKFGIYIVRNKSLISKNEEDEP